MNQRLVSALGLACRPGWVIADEPTKGLDAVIRNQVYTVLRQIYAEHHCSMIVITHDLALAVGCATISGYFTWGRSLSRARQRRSWNTLTTPIPQGLIYSLPSRGMVPIPLPDPNRLSHSGCPFYPRCPKATARCGKEKPGDYLLPTGGKVRCFLYE